MGISLISKSETYEIGTPSFFGSFFDTIDYHLTKGIFGKKYPIVLGEFQNGELSFENLEKAEKELLIIQKKLKKYNPSKIIWDKYDLSKNPPWGNNISSDITNLSNYFVTSDGKDLFDVLFSAIKKAKDEKSSLKIG